MFILLIILPILCRTFNSDKKKYIQEQGPGPDNVLSIGGQTPSLLTGNGDDSFVVKVAANKNNEAYDIIIGDALVDIEGQWMSAGAWNIIPTFILNVE